MSAADVLVVGAGVAGLAAAGALQAAGRRVVVIDKGRSPGGRLATRRLGDGRADHGAQFFTVRSPELATVVAGWLDGGLAYEWSRGWSDGSLLEVPPDHYPRYAARDGFSALAKYLAAGLDVRLNTRLISVARSVAGWQSVDEAGGLVEASALLLTPPVPQSLLLLDAGAVALMEADRVALDAITYAPCLCGLFVVAGETRLPEPGALQRPDHAVSWIADNHRKGISPARRVLTVHAGRKSSQARWDAEDAAVLAWLEQELRPFLVEDAVIEERQLKRWRYAVPEVVFPRPCLIAQLDALLVFAGDAFDGPRVEGAVLSGWAAARALLDRL